MSARPDVRGHFGDYGGRYVPETLMPALDELDLAWREARDDEAFRRELEELLRRFAGRPTPLGEARRWSAEAGGCRILLKREDLCHTGAHKINNTLGQVLLARRMGKRRIIAETGAGQHGVATATAAALFGLPCDVYMGALDVERQALNVFRMQLLGARVIPVEAGSRTLKDAMNEAIRDWVTNVRDTHYIIGSVAGPHPYPALVRDFQAVIGDEARAQVVEYAGRLPDAVIACVGGGSNAMGIFNAFLGDFDVKLVGVEAAGHGLDTGKHGAALARGRPGVLHGSRSYVLQTPDGQIAEAHSISAGLDYPGVGPELSYLKDTGRVTLMQATDDEALEALQFLARTEGIIPALESAHAVAAARLVAEELGEGGVIVVNVSGRGDKDVVQLTQALAKPQAPGPSQDLALRERAVNECSRDAGARSRLSGPTESTAHEEFTPPAQTLPQRCALGEGQEDPPMTAPRKAAKTTRSGAARSTTSPPTLALTSQDHTGDRIAATFAACRARGETALVTYVMAGDPDLATSRAMALACAEGGADLLELGMPFSDPIADGPTIQLAAERSLAAGTNVAACLELAASVRARSEIPIALMGYVNPVLSYGEERFVEDCARAGVDAVILPDLPPEEAEDFRALARSRGLATVFLLAPTSTPARRAAACGAASGFLYFVSVTGVTGARRDLSDDLPRQVEAVRRESPVPVVVGFGVSTPAQARALAPLADGVVVGSAIVSRIAEGGSRKARADRVRRFVASLKRALRP